jgi:glycosyltransferase involved in cell wall biosynthesis
MRVAVLALGPVGLDTGGRTYLSEILPALANQPGLVLEAHLSDPGLELPAACRVVRHRVLPGPAGRILAERRVAASLARGGCDVLLAPLNYLPGGWHGPSVCVQHNVLSLPSAVGASRDVSRLRRWYRPRALARTLDRATEIVAVSEHLRRLLLADFPTVDERRIRVIPLGADSGWAQRPDRAPSGRILVVSALWDYKRVDLALEAFARLSESLPDATLRVAGPGSPAATKALEDLAARLGVAERIEFLGNVPRAGMPRLYEWADVFLHLSLIESFSLPVLEAMAAGVPVVATRAGGLAEIGGDAPVWLDEAATAEETAAALRRVLTDEPLRVEAVRHGRAQAAAFTWEHSASLLADTLRAAGGRG